jgi:heptosyltransferase II
VGDALMTTPIVHSIRKSFPLAQITVLAKPWVASVFEASPDVDHLVIYQKPGIHQGMGGKARLAKALKIKRYDIVIHFPHSFESAWISYWSRIPVRIGFATEGRGLLLTHPLRQNQARRKEHQVPFFFHLLEPLGIREDPTPEKHLLRLTVSPTYQEQARVRLQSLGVKPSDFLVALAPGAIYGSAKCWPFDRFEQLAERLKKEWGAQILLLGTDNDALAGINKNRSGTHDLMGKTSLGEALALIQNCRLMICNDSGMMHGAAALKTPLVALFGSTNVHRTGPWGGVSRTIRKDFFCSPCLRKVCSKSPTCMEAISVDEVWKTLLDLREENPI